MSNDNSRHTLEPFKIAVSQTVLDDLATRLRATRWAPDWNNEDKRYGMSTAYLRPLAEYWADGFDWRAMEAELEIFAHYRVEIDRAPIHFLREPGRGPAPIPIILSHGWPWTFWDWSKVVRPLADPASFGGDPADAFDVVVVSLIHDGHELCAGRRRRGAGGRVRMHRAGSEARGQSLDTVRAGSCVCGPVRLRRGQSARRPAFSGRTP